MKYSIQGLKTVTSQLKLINKCTSLLVYLSEISILIT